MVSALVDVSSVLFLFFSVFYGSIIGTTHNPTNSDRQDCHMILSFVVIPRTVNGYPKHPMESLSCANCPSFEVSSARTPKEKLHSRFHQ